MCQCCDKCNECDVFQRYDADVNVMKHFWTATYITLVTYMYTMCLVKRNHWSIKRKTAILTLMVGRKNDNR